MSSNFVGLIYKRWQFRNIFGKIFYLFLFIPAFHWTFENTYWKRFHFLWYSNKTINHLINSIISHNFEFSSSRNAFSECKAYFYEFLLGNTCITEWYPFDEWYPYHQFTYSSALLSVGCFAFSCHLLLVLIITNNYIHDQNLTKIQLLSFGYSISMICTKCH